MKKLLALILALVMACALAACGSSGSNSGTGSNTPATPSSDVQDDNTADSTGSTDVKIGCILIGDENEGYSNAHIAGIQEAIEATGIPAENVIMKYNVPEN